MENAFPEGDGSGAGGAAQRHGKAGLHLGYETHHVNANKCQVWGKQCFFRSRAKLKNACSPFPVAKELSAVEGWREGSTPSPLSPPATAAPLGRARTGPL